MAHITKTGGRAPSVVPAPTLQALVSLDSLDVFGVPEIPSQPNTLNSTYQRIDMPQRQNDFSQKYLQNTEAQQSLEAKSIDSKKLSAVQDNKKYQRSRNETSNVTPKRSAGQTMPSANTTSSPERLPVWQQQPAWRQASHESKTKKDLNLQAASTSRASSSPRAIDQSGAQSVMARRPRESSLNMEERHNAAVRRQKSTMRGNLSRAGSTASAEAESKRSGKSRNDQGIPALVQDPESGGECCPCA